MKQLCKLWRVVLALGLSCIAAPCFAASYGFGETASAMFGITEVAGEFMRIICIITGGAMLLGSLMKYKKYRKNPVEVKLSSVFVMFLTALALIAVGLLPMFVGVHSYSIYSLVDPYSGGY